MDKQISIFDYFKIGNKYKGDPDYQGSNDEIIRGSIENRFTLSIPLDYCCGAEPKEYFISCHDYKVKCPVCGKQTKWYPHLYKAKQAWNRGERAP